MAGEMNTIMNTLKHMTKQVIDSTMPMDYVTGYVVSDEYKPLEIKVEGFYSVLNESDLILTNNVRDHWLDIEVYWETVDDNDLSEFQENHYTNVDTHNENSKAFNEHKHPGCQGGSTGTPDKEMKDVTKRHTSHLHNIQGRKKIRVYNGLHTGELVLLLRCAGGDKYIVVDRLSSHIVDGEWRTHIGAGLETQETLPFGISEDSVLYDRWKEGAIDESKWKRFSKPQKFVPGGEPPGQ